MHFSCLFSILFIFFCSKLGRYIGLWVYKSYLQKFTGGPDWRITLKYTLPNIVFSVIFNLPKFFEFDVQEIVETNSETNTTYAKINLNPTNLRLDDNYVYYYVNWSRFLVSGLIPLVSLTVLNFAIYR